MQKHVDTAWKEILEQYFPDFLAYCLPRFYQIVNWDKGWESMDTELHAITKDNLTGTRIVDKLFRVTLNNGENQLVLIHIDVQGEPENHFAKGMFTYSIRSFDRHDKPILSCAVLTDDNPAWRPSFYEIGVGGSKLRLDFLVIKLLDFHDRQQQLEISQNPFASVILIQLAALAAKTKKLSDNKRFDLKFTLMRRLYEKGFSKKQIKDLYIFIDWLISLPKELEFQYRVQVIQYEERHKMPYISNIERMGIEQGMQQGKRESMLIAAKRMLAKGIDIQTITQVTELSVTEINILQEENV